MRNERHMERRQVVGSGLAAGAWAMLGVPLSALGVKEPVAGDELVPFLDVQPVNPQRPMTIWHELDSWLTPESEFFTVKHYPAPQPADPAAWKLSVGGLVERPVTLSLGDLKKRKRVEHIATLECSGNGASYGFMGAIGNARWVGTPLAPILKDCRLSDAAREIVFFGADRGKEKVRDQELEQSFARSLSREDASRPTVMLAYEMNGKPLSHEHGAPVRLVVPGWYGVAWVKWLDRIEAHDRRFMGRFMARDYVTIRGEPRGEQIVWRETSVGPMRIKSIVARVIRRADGTVEVLGAAWNDGTPLKSVELKIDDGPWRTTRLSQDEKAPHAWTFWSLEWKGAAPGEHTLVSRAADAEGRVQPAADDPSIALKKTYWEANQQVIRRIRL
jgi:DMSO/TMAO reductase YedYZ molybdopterin-dependent catalytic subunit